MFIVHIVVKCMLELKIVVLVSEIGFQYIIIICLKEFKMYPNESWIFFFFFFLDQQWKILDFFFLNSTTSWNFYSAKGCKPIKYIPCVPSLINEYYICYNFTILFWFTNFKFKSIPSIYFSSTLVAFGGLQRDCSFFTL